MEGHHLVGGPGRVKPRTQPEVTGGELRQVQFGAYRQMIRVIPSTIRSR